MGIGLGILAAFITGMVCLAQPASAKTRALVVGVSTYPALPEALHLKGPRNDAREVANALVSFGIEPANVTVLADGVERLAGGIAAPGPGTRAAILSSLDALAAASGPGDLVVFYFSGHGAQQPDLDGDEQGGNDEIFLPYDTGSWSSTGVENALVDDDLAASVGRILDTGADFFGIIDACHSATGFRALGDEDVRARQVDPAALGIPEGVAPGPVHRTLDLPSTEAGRGRAAFFYAAQENEVALEKKPRDAGSEEIYGVFTYNLLRRLNRDPRVSYRTLHEAVISDIKRGTLMATQTPELEGDLLDEPALRLSDAPPLRQWPLRAGKLLAGQLHGLSDGALLALYDDPAAPDDAVIATAVIEVAGAATSEIIAADGVDPAALKKARYARLVEPGVDLAVTLSLPIRVDAADGHDYGPALAALETALASPRLAARVSARDRDFDIAVGLVDGRLAFASAGGTIDAASPRLTLPDDPQAAASAIAAAIERIARATGLHRLAEVAGGGAAALSSGLLVSRLEPPARGACPDPDDLAYGAPQAVTGPPSLADCDIVSVALRNDGRKSLDVSVLLLGADFSIVPLWPEDGQANRIHPGEQRALPLLRMEPDDDRAGGEERVLVIAVPGSGRSHTSFSHFEQEGVRAATDEAGEDVVAARELIAASLSDMDLASTRPTASLAEEIVIEILPFHGADGAGG